MGLRYLGGSGEGERVAREHRVEPSSVDAHHLVGASARARARARARDGAGLGLGIGLGLGLG